MNPLVEEIKKTIGKFQNQKLCSSDEVCDAFLDLMLLAERAEFPEEESTPVLCAVTNN